MIACISDVDGVANALHRGGIGEHSFNRSRLGQQVEWRFVEITGGCRFFNHLGDGAQHRIGIEFAFVFADDAAIRADEHERRPGAHRVFAPDAHRVIVDDRVVDVQSTNRILKMNVEALGRVLGAMDADDEELIVEVGFEIPQLRDDVQAVDSAVGPEIENDELASQVGDLQRALGVEPGQPIRELGRTDGSRVHARHSSSPYSEVSSDPLASSCSVSSNTS